MRARARLIAPAVLAAALLAGCGGAARPVPKMSSIQDPNRPGPVTIFTAGGVSTYTPETLQLLKQLGVDRIHIYLHWADVAPDAQSRHRPAFSQTDPNAYPAPGWAPFDAAIRAAGALHLGIDVALIPPGPLWAQGPGVPHKLRSSPAWKPNPAWYGEWVQAVGARYSGHFKPPDQSSPLPRVTFWSIWNEPNLGTQLAPQTTEHGALEVAPAGYRALVDAAWTGLHASGHGGDTILIGELAPAGMTTGNGPGVFGMTPGLRFLRALYCVDSSYRPLTGPAATARACPASAAASSRFAAAHPGLFHASGFADHPYTFGPAPDVVIPNEPDYTELAAIPELAQTLDRLQRVYGSTTRLPIWSTEFGYVTNPPDGSSDAVPPRLAAYYLNWAEYLTWLNPRMRSYDQYLLQDPPSADGPNPFASGLLTDAGAPKPAFFAFRMPIYLPARTGATGRPLAVWGCVRPAPLAARTSHRRQYAQIQFSPGASGPFKTVDRVPIISRHGYFEVAERFPSSGRVRIAWTAPHGARITSRTVSIVLR